MRETTQAENHVAVVPASYLVQARFKVNRAQAALGALGIDESEKFMARIREEAVAVAAALLVMVLIAVSPVAMLAATVAAAIATVAVVTTVAIVVATVAAAGVIEAVTRGAGA